MYQVVLTPDEEGGFDAVVPDLPGCFSFGGTREEAIAMAADSAKTYVASFMLHGDRYRLPAPMRLMGQHLWSFLRLMRTKSLKERRYLLPRPHVFSE